jgi:predicted amidohydrolase
MKIAIYQGSELSQTIDQNLQCMATQAKLAAAQSASLLIFPEMFLTGYNIGPQSISEMSEPADGKSALAIARIAMDTGIAVLYGYPEFDSGKIFNSAQVIDRQGNSLANYRKTHLFGDIDHSAFDAGDTGILLFELDGWLIGILICYDIEFPENMRQLALAGADFVVVPTALMKPYEFVPLTMVPSRAYENQLFVAYANRCGIENELEYHGLSCIVGPDGKDLARAGASECLIFTDLERHLLVESRRLNTYLKDRRPELYKSLTL